MNNMEIEKKYLVKAIPDNLENFECHRIAQGYVSTEPVVRIRQWDDEYILTIKSSGLLSHIEIEKSLTEDEFKAMTEMVKGNTIAKKRYIIPLISYGYPELELELDIFEGALDGLIIAEVEFSDTEKAESFVAPDFLGTEVTNDPRYYNSYLSTIDQNDIDALISK